MVLEGKGLRMLSQKIGGMGCQLGAMDAAEKQEIHCFVQCAEAEKWYGDSVEGK